jgi:hypothetical protein
MFDGTLTNPAFSDPFASRANPDAAIAAIKAKVAQSGFRSGARVTRRQRAGVAAAAIAPVTVAGIILIRCGCSQAAWMIEIATAIIFSLWTVASRP